MSNKILALYDFASKQDYIYKTSKIKEISGASLLLDGMYQELIALYNDKCNNKFIYDLSKPFCMNDFEASDYDAEVLYDGGGNLMVIYKGTEKYHKANNIFSKHIVRYYPGLTMIASHVNVTGVFDNDDKSGDRDRLYTENAKRKNLSPAYDMPAVTPFTQIDPMTFLPVTYKRNANSGNNIYASESSLSSDRVSKALKYKNSSLKSNFDDDEGMLAVIYIDGNSMGKKLQACRDSNYDKGIKKLRDFSENVKNIYVNNPLDTIKEKFGETSFRKVIGGGDEITIICKAENALKIMKTYFECLDGKKINGESCTSCAGIAVFHAKSPFSVAYGIAEAACESAKQESRSDDGNYFDFYYCHSGITDSFENLREYEQSHTTGRPYAVSDLSSKFKEYKKILNKAGRSNVKDLGEAAQISPQQYKFEASRVNAYLGKNSSKLTYSEEEMKLVYDMSEFYDLWFSNKEDGGNNNE